MRPLIVVAALFLGLTAHAQPTRDANPREGQNTQGANAQADAMDPATKARVRAEGAAGGTGAKVPPEASGGGTVGRGRQNRHSAPKPPDTQQAPVEKSDKKY
jgi:hypothetical protein